MRSARRSTVDPFIVMDVMEAARKAEEGGRHIVHMEVGQPSSPAPQAARRAVAQALESDALGYTVALGRPDLRAGIADLYRHWYGVDLDPSRVVVTAGSSAAFVLAFTALFDADEAVGVPRPGYPSYRQILRALSLRPVDLVTDAENGHALCPDTIARADCAGVMVASPNNPTGTMLDHAQLAALIDAAGTRAFISDEIYHGLHYGDRAVSALEISDDVYVINSFSKYFSMTGWRIGWMVVPEDHVRRIERLAQNMFICAPHVAQVAALAALGAIDKAESHRSTYAENRKIMVDGLQAAGLTRIAPPDGAFYVYADVGHLTQDSRALAARILDEAGVAVIPGLDFDPERGHRTLRFSYARSTADIREGIARLRAFFDQLTPDAV